MSATINVKQLRSLLPQLIERVRKGARYTVLYRSQPAFEIVPVGAPASTGSDLEGDTLYRAPAVGRSTDGKSAADHDSVLYRR